LSCPFWVAWVEVSKRYPNYPQVYHTQCMEELRAEPFFFDLIQLSKVPNQLQTFVCSNPW